MIGKSAILAIDQGTTSSRAIVFDLNGKQIASAQQEFPQIFPHDGWVEHNPEDIWKSTISVSRTAFEQAETAGFRVECIGITNQRETTVVWDKTSSKPIYNAIVWQDRRTADTCAKLKAAGHEFKVTTATGLLLDPYFSGTKLAWILENVDGARKLALDGKLAFGTIDTFLIWRLSAGKTHVTDATNAARTLMFNIHTQSWDQDMLNMLDIPVSVLPEVKDCAADFAVTDSSIFGRSIPIGGVAGDQQAALVGQACFEPGMLKSTYGTGCFAILNTGDEAVRSTNRLLTTVGYRLNGKTTYALEGSIFVAGAAIQWLRDKLGLIIHASETEELANSIPNTNGVYLVPAFTGLGAPYWDPHARGALFGLTRDSGRAEIVRAALEAVCYQTSDLMKAMTGDTGVPAKALRVDGGMVTNNWLMQYLADILSTPVQRPAVIETTALGAAYLAGLQAGLYGSLGEIAAQWRQEAEFTPQMDKLMRADKLNGWEQAVAKTLVQKQLE